MKSWTRLEGVPRGAVEVGVQARLADPLWLLTRQWQLGELQAEDAGSPAEVRLAGTADRLTRFAPHVPDGTLGMPLDVGNIPLEALVEVETQPKENELSPAFAARAGLQAVRVLRAAFPAPAAAAPLTGYVDGLTLQFPLAERSDTDDPVLRLAAGRAPDGQALYHAFAPSLRATVPTLPDAPPLAGLDAAKVIAALQEYLSWFDELTGRALPQTNAWAPGRFEYQFAVSAATANGELVLAATEYDSGSLDWSSVDIVPNASLGAQTSDPGAARRRLTYKGVPTPVAYRGMPSPRWWELEDNQVDLGDLTAPAEELATMLTIEFAIRYSNDHFLLPVPLELGSVASIDALVVQDTFGARLLIEHVSAVDGQAGAFRLFEHSTGTEARSSAFVLLPVLDESLQGEPIEDIWLFRDEMANLAWAVEATAQGPDGIVVDRATQWQAARQAAEEARPAALSTPEDPTVRIDDYRVRTDIADYWYPLLANAGTNRNPLLTLGSVKPLDGGTPPQPWGRVLSEIRGVQIPFEEVPREGVRVIRSWQYARWTDGSVLVWVGRRARPGRSGGASGLRFDLLEPNG